MSVGKSKLRWFQFGILDLLLLTTIAAVVVLLLRPPRIEAGYEPLVEGTTPGQHWAGNGLRMKFRWCPAGEFKMGEPPNQVDVTLSRGFWLGKFEVTQGAYRQVMSYNPSPPTVDMNADTLPVNMVTWDEAVEFCRVFTEQERKAGRLSPGWEYRLPTEAQWEYACRAGTQTKYSFGDDEERLADFAWYRENAEDRTHEVGQKLPNAWGLHDMHGNVEELCSDWYYAILAGGTDPEVTEQHSLRPLRGGGWYDPRGICWSASRCAGAPDRGDSLVGFRVALVQSTR